MGEDQDRLAELLGAAAAGELTDAETAELDAWAAADPAVARERRATLEAAALVDSSWWRREDPPADLEDVVVAATGRGARSRARRSRVRLAVAAAALVAAGSAGTIAVDALTGGPPEGPPGTLGAYEPVTFDAPADEARVGAEVVAHTWGTEAVLEVEGLVEGASYEVIFLDDEGRRRSAGAFLGSAVPIDCRVNAAVLREDVRELVITTDDGQVVRSAELPAVTG
ncbi:hypothetical protein GCM10009821_14910 [Aeromicrobium halocynthiae]|uniref:Anti-sigma factor n=2 Tax=Aeromicrobium halocynthiae TaxID=560557 RepID=A0ABN2VYI7_9ACTN